MVGRPTLDSFYLDFILRLLILLLILLSSKRSILFILLSFIIFYLFFTLKLLLLAPPLPPPPLQGSPESLRGVLLLSPLFPGCVGRDALARLFVLVLHLRVHLALARRPGHPVLQVSHTDEAFLHGSAGGGEGGGG